MKKEKVIALFTVGLVAKIIFLFFSSSPYMTDLFIPFLDSAVLNPGKNPWELMPPQNFPYGSVLFVILWIPRFIAHHFFGDAALGAGAFGLALVKGPLLCLDLLFLAVLRTIEPRKTEALLVFYWLNPVLFYITYIHGQLDIASTVFCALSLLLLARKRTFASAAAMSAATLCKFHVVLIIPFMMIYLWNREFAKQARRDIGGWLLAWGGLSIVGFLPLIFAGRLGYATAASPEAFRLFAAQITYGPNQTLQLGVLIVLAVLGRLCLSTTITEKGLIFGSTALLSTLLLATDPMPGWYFWVLPFFALFFALYLNVPRSLFWLHNAVYFAYFVPACREFLTAIPLGPSIVFTVLQASLAGIILAIWILSIRQEARVLRRARPMAIGVAGDSGAGKNRLSLLLQDLFNPNQTLLVEGDDYHRWERGDANWDKYTHLDPRANHLPILEDHARLLSRGFSVQQSHYDHQTGTFSDPREMKPAKVVIFQGLHSFYLRGARNRLDLRIFLAPDPMVRLGWKLDRDTAERGHSAEKVLASFTKRKSDSKTYIEPQRDHADWVIEVLPARPLTQDEVCAGTRTSTILRHSIPNDPSVDRVVSIIEAVAGGRADFKLTTDAIPGEIHRVSIEYAGELSLAEIESVASTAFPNPRRITRGRTPPVLRAGFDGLNQLMALALLEGMAPEEAR